LTLKLKRDNSQSPRR